jgi:chitinase
MITTYGFDGIDLDWEYPVEGGLEGNKYRAEDGANYTLLVQEIRRQLTALEATDGADKHYLLTIAGPAGYDKIENFDLDGMAPYLDWFQVMAYDFHGGSWENKTGHQAGLYGNPESNEPMYNVQHAIDLYMQQVDPSKIVLGSPAYGRSWTGVPDGGTHGLNQVGTGPGIGTWEKGVVDYWQIVNLVDQQPDVYHVYWDDVAKAPYIYSTANGGTFITYENPESLQYKLDYIKDLGLGGIMFWELDSDVRDSNDPDSLIGLAAKELLGDQSSSA